MAAAILAVLALFLAACSAQVDSVISLEPELSGQRTITATLEKSDTDAENISGGFDAVDATAQRHLPQGLTYEGMEDDGTNVRLTFTLPFDSAEDYRSTVSSILSAADTGIEPDITMAVPDSPLVSGVELQENFSSADLLDWLSKALVEDGVVDASNEGSILQAGSATVEFDGQTYESNSGLGNLSVSEVQDYGFTSIEVETTLQADGRYEQSMTFVNGNELTEDISAAVDSHFESTGLADQVEDRSTGGFQGGEWVLNHQADTVEEMNAATAKILGGPSALSVETAPDPDHPTTFRTVVEGNYDCSAICSPAGDGLTHHLAFPADWGVVNGGDGVTPTGDTEATAEARFEGLVALREVPLASVAVDTAIGFNQSVTQTLTFSASRDNVQRVGDAFEQLLRPDDGIGSFSTAEGDDKTTYTTVIESASTAEHNEKLGRYIPGAMVEIYAPEGVAFWPDYQVELTLPLADSLVRSGAGSASSTLSLPPLHTVSSGLDAQGATVAGESTITVDGLERGSYLTAYAAGPTMDFWILWAVLLLVIVVFAIAAVVFRKRLKDWWRKTAQRRHEWAHSASSGPQGTSHAGRTLHETSTSDLAGAGPVDPSTREFSEAQLH